MNLLSSVVKTLGKLGSVWHWKFGQADDASMPAAKVTDEALSFDHRTSFRRKSIDEGLIVSVNFQDYNQITLKQVSGKLREFQTSSTSSSPSSSSLEDSANVVAQAYVDLVKACRGNVENAIREFCDEVLPDGDDAVLTRAILLSLGPKIKPGA